MGAYAELFRALAPEQALVVAALVVVGWDLSDRKREMDRESANARRQRTAAGLGALGVLVAMGLSVGVGVMGDVYGGALALDSLAVATRLGSLGLVGLTLTVVAGAKALEHPAEYVALILFGAVGFLQMAAARQLLLAFLALELASLSLYVLVGYDKRRPESAEAALKYFLVGGMSAAFLLFGFSLLYGLTGSIELPEIARALSRQEMSPLLAVALVMTLVAFGFKAAVAPFHLWAPDAYQGAPTSTAALVASASKLAGFALFWRLFWPGLAPMAHGDAVANGMPGWIAVMAVMAGASLLIGNFAALAQSNVRRLLAYSAISHAGALALGLLSAGQAGPGPLFYYALTYGIATVGAFGTLAVVERDGPCEKISDLAGLQRRSPLLAGCLLVFVLSLAGIPPLAGFFGKFLVFTVALRTGGVASPAGVLALLAIAMSAVALYYYLVLLKQALVVAPAEGKGRISTPMSAALGLIVAAGLLVALGIFPGWVLHRVGSF